MPFYSIVVFGLAGAFDIDLSTELPFVIAIYFYVKKMNG